MIVTELSLPGFWHRPARPLHQKHRARSPFAQLGNQARKRGNQRLLQETPERTRTVVRRETRLRQGVERLLRNQQPAAPPVEPGAPPNTFDRKLRDLANLF